MSLLATLLAAGPSVIRLFAKSQGDLVQKSAHFIADQLDKYLAQPDADARAALESSIDSMPAETVALLKVELEKLAVERERISLDHDVQMHTAQQKTIRTSKDVKGVRPEIANRHSWFVFLYVVMFELGEVLGKGSGADWEIAMLIASPVLAWFGFRTWDKFSRKGASA